MYEGQSGLRAILNDIITVGEDVLIIGNFSNFSKVTGHIASQFIMSRIKNNIYCKYISEDSRISREVRLNDKKELRETRFLKTINDSNSEMYIYGNKVAQVTISKNQPVGIIIENTSIANLQKTLFYELWAVAEKQ